MKSDFEEYICTTCGESLKKVEATHRGDDDLHEAELVCTDCNIHYPVIRGIPRFVSPENYAGSFGYQWNIHRQTQLDSYTNLSISRDRLDAVSGWSNHLEGERILEAGSGAGRFTQVLAQKGADLFSFDYSNAVDANLKNNCDMPNLHLFQGDIFNIPLQECSFDKVICLGVLQHTPDPELAFKSLTKYVKPDGELVIDIYRADFLAWFQWKYLLRPLTKRINKVSLYKLISFSVPILIPFARLMRKLFGRAGARLSPIVEYSHLGLPPEMNKEWAVLDTFDMYSPAHDHPQSLNTIKRWFIEAGFADVIVKKGPNGIIGKGKNSRKIENGGS